MQVEEHNAPHSFHQRYKNSCLCIQETSPTSLSRTHNYQQLFYCHHFYHNQMLCWSMKILLQQATPETKHLQLHAIIKKIISFFILMPETEVLIKGYHGSMSIYFCKVFFHCYEHERVQSLPLPRRLEMNTRALITTNNKRIHITHQTALSF